MTDWIILRTAGRSTLGLAESLAKDGFEVWTPVETRAVQVNRKRCRDIHKPIMPGYIFARLTHLVDLRELARMKVKPRRGAGLREPAHADFSVLQSPEGRIQAARDKDLDGLREVELRHTPRRLRPQPKQVPVGAEVTVSPLHGSFGGLVGKVEEVQRGQALVCFNGRFLVKIPTFHLEMDDIYGSVKAALAA